MGLLCGLTPWHIRLLVDDPWTGGKGQRLADMGRMTLDQVLFLLCDKDKLKDRKRIVETSSIVATEDGMIKGRSEDGKPMEAKILGKSLARRLIEEQEAAAKPKPEKRRRKRGGK